MKRVGIVLFTVFSILFLIAVGVATMLLVGEDEADSTPTVTVTEPPTAAPTEPRLTLTPGRTQVAPQPTRTPRPTTTPAPTAVSQIAEDAINAADVIELDTLPLEGAPDAQNAIRSLAWAPDGAAIAVPEPANNSPR